MNGREKMAQEAIVTVLRSWVFSLTYTLLLAAGHCSTWIQLQTLESWRPLLVLLDSQGALCGLLLYFECCVSLLIEGSTVYKFLFSLWHVLLDCIAGHILGKSHHSRLRWASSSLNRNIQVSWVVSWKAYRWRGVPVFIWKRYDQENL